MAPEVDPHEAELRRLRRQVAEVGKIIAAGERVHLGPIARSLLPPEVLEYHERQARAAAPVLPVDADTGWHWGTCARCHAEDLVKGPPSQPLCIYCDQLRIMPPPPARRQPAQPARPGPPVEGARLIAGTLFGAAGFFMALAGVSWNIAGVFVLVSFILTIAL